MSNLAHAQLLNLEDIADIAPNELIPEEAFNDQTEFIEEAPFNDKGLAFSVRLPKGWISNIKLPVNMIGKEEGAHLLGMVSSFVSPAQDHLRSLFSVEAIALEYNIPTKHWFTYYALAQGYSLEAVTIHSPDRVEAIYVEVEGDLTYVVRILAINNADRMILVRYRVPMDRFNEEKAMQEQVLASFSLEHPLTGGAEKMKTYAFLTESYFDYPETWTLIPKPIRSINRMQASLAQGDQEGDVSKLDGQMSIFVTSRYEKTSLRREVKLFREKLDIPNYKLGAFLEKREMPFRQEMTFAATEVYKLNPTVSTQVEYELWLSIMQNEDYFYIVSLLTPSREAKFYKWARNVEAFKAVVGSLRRYDGEDALFIE